VPFTILPTPFDVPPEIYVNTSSPFASAPLLSIK
jgi:hypothetical protein